MTETTTLRTELARVIDTIEGGYEFLLAYAAQGRHTDRDTSGAQSPRERLAAIAEATAELPGLARSMAGSISESFVAESAAFLDALDRDAGTAGSALRLVLSRKDLSSQLIDSLNASIHLRALLTDIFLVDEVFKP